MKKRSSFMMVTALSVIFILSLFMTSFFSDASSYSVDTFPPTDVPSQSLAGTDPDPLIFTDTIVPPAPAPDEFAMGIYVYNGLVLPQFLWGVTEGGVKDWYRIIVTTASGSSSVLDLWRQGSAVCQASLCTVIPDLGTLPVGLLNGEYRVVIRSVPQSASEINLNYMFTALFNIQIPAPQFLPTPGAVDVSTGIPIINLPNDLGTSWYHIWVGPADLSSALYVGWVSKSDVQCQDSGCMIPLDVNPPNGEYAVYMQLWGPAGYNSNNGGAWIYVDDFEINLPAPGLVIPSSTVVNGTNVTFYWEGQATATWYNVWLGKADFTQTAHYQWYSAAALGCVGGGSCTLSLDNAGLQSGTQYLWYIQSWGPGGFSTGGDEGGWTKSEVFAA